MDGAESEFVRCKNRIYALAPYMTVERCNAHRCWPMVTVNYTQNTNNRRLGQCTIRTGGTNISFRRIWDLTILKLVIPAGNLSIILFVQARVRHRISAIQSTLWPQWLCVGQQRINVVEEATHHRNSAQTYSSCERSVLNGEISQSISIFFHKIISFERVFMFIFYFSLSVRLCMCLRIGNFISALILLAAIY